MVIISQLQYGERGFETPDRSHAAKEANIA
jgi:hypothetical protein